MRRSYLPKLTNEELVLGALVGDVEAFDELARRFRGAVTAIARSVLGSSDAAEDAAQDAFLLAFRALPQLDHPARFGAWLCAITRHRARRMAERGSRCTSLEDCNASHDGDEPLPDEVLMRSERQAAVRRAIGALPVELREVVALRYEAELSIVEISRFLSLPVATVKWRLYTSREKLCRRLAPDWKERNEREY